MLARGFSCAQCAAAPVLQQVQGCFEDAPRVFARYATYEFRRCPLTYHAPRAILLVRAARAKQVPCTAKALEAGRYIDFLLKLEAADDDRT